MGDNSLLKQAHYSVVTNFTGLSSDIQLPIEIQQLSSKVIPIQSITKELEWISQYSDVEKETHMVGSTIEAMIEENDRNKNATVVSVATGNNSSSSHDQLITQMIQKTNQDRDLCFFFLESVNWDLNQAIEMLNNLQTN